MARVRCSVCPVPATKRPLVDRVSHLRSPGVGVLRCLAITSRSGLSAPGQGELPPVLTAPLRYRDGFAGKARIRALRQEARGIPTTVGATADPEGAQRYLDADRRIAEINRQLGDA